MSTKIQVCRNFKSSCERQQFEEDLNAGTTDNFLHEASFSIIFGMATDHHLTGDIMLYF